MCGQTRIRAQIHKLHFCGKEAPSSPSRVSTADGDGFRETVMVIMEPTMPSYFFTSLFHIFHFFANIRFPLPAMPREMVDSLTLLRLHLVPLHLVPLSLLLSLSPSPSPGLNKLELHVPHLHPHTSEDLAPLPEAGRHGPRHVVAEGRRPCRPSVAGFAVPAPRPLASRESPHQYRRSPRPCSPPCR